jgi:hypothetical protein
MKQFQTQCFPAQRDPVFSTDPFQSPSREGVRLGLLREITQPVFDVDA